MPYRKKAPDIVVSERDKAAQEHLYSGDFQKADEIIKARLQSGVFEYASTPIELKDDTLVPRWFNADISSDHIWRAINRRGWVPVKKDMLKDPSQLGAFQISPSGHVVKGQRGQERLLCMKKERYAEIVEAKERSNRKLIGSSARTKSAVEERASSELGAEAADWIHDRIIGEVKDSVEPIERIEDPEAELKRETS